MSSSFPMGRSAAFLGVLLSASACAHNIEKVQFGSVNALATTAQYRLVMERPGPEGRPVVCTEPSPDVALAFSSALGVGLSAKVKEVDASANAQYQLATAVAQLGKRYATVQLLRDVMYRDCELYANGLITQTEYAYRLARFGGLLVTLMGIEMASGDATLPGPVSSPTLPAPEKGGSGKVEQPATGKAETGAVGDKGSADAGAAGDKAGAASSPKTSLKAVESSTGSNKTPGSAGGGSTEPNPAAAAPTPVAASGITEKQVAAIQEMQKTYIETQNVVALLAACTVATDGRSGGSSTTFAQFCKGYFDLVLKKLELAEWTPEQLQKMFESFMVNRNRTMDFLGPVPPQPTPN